MLKSLVAAASAAVLVGVGASSAFAQAVPIDAFARAPAMGSVSMSTEGDLLVGVIADPNNPDSKALATWDISNIDQTRPLQPSFITPSGRMTFQAATALKAGRIIAAANQVWTGALAGCGEGRTTGATRTWVFQSYVFDRTIREPIELFQNRRALGVSDAMAQCLNMAGGAGLAADLPLDPDSVIISRRDLTSLGVTYYKLNLRTNETVELYRDNDDAGIDLIDPRDGRVRVKSKVEPMGNLRYEQQFFILNPDTGAFDREMPLTVDFANRNQMSVVDFDEETGKYYVITDKFSDHAAVYLYDARTDKFDAEPLFAHQDFDASGVILGLHQSNFGKLLGFSYDGAQRATYWTDPEMRSVQEGLDRAFPGQAVRLIDYTAGLGKILFAATGPNHPTSYYLLLNKTKVMMVGNARPWIRPEQLGTGQLVYYQARDGLRIPGLLTLPPGFVKGTSPPPPAIVLPHGGPWSRDYLDWDATGWTQFLATRGYAVLQPQYRGSTGWGHNLWLAGDGEWGQKMQDDNDDGAAWLVSQGYAAQGRVGIFGYSYGGFAAFAASVRPNGPFKCAIAGAGVANLTRIGNNWGESRQQRAYQGNSVKGMDPQQNTAKLAMPIFIFHGDRDVRVPLFHAQDFYNSVRSTGRAKLLVLRDMGHQLDKWSPDNVRQVLGGIEGFLKNECAL